MEGLKLRISLYMQEKPRRLVEVGDGFAWRPLIGGEAPIRATLVEIAFKMEALESELLI